MTKDTTTSEYTDKFSTGSKKTNKLSRSDNTSMSTNDRPAVFIEPSNKHNHSTKIIKKR